MEAAAASPGNTSATSESSGLPDPTPDPEVRLCHAPTKTGLGVQKCTIATRVAAKSTLLGIRDPSA